jgi:flagellar motor protein MotB
MAKAKSCHCKKAGECEECPEWIFTFADLVMLMMGFFVILWVLKPNANPQVSDKSSQAQTDEWIETVGEIRGGFGWEPDPRSSDPVDKAIIRKRAKNGPGEKGIMQRQSKGAQGTDPEVTSIRPGQQSTVGGKLIFDKGDATITPEVAHSLDEVAKSIRGHRNIIMIKGHTSRDDFPDDVTALQQMDLSLRRAQAVSDFLAKANVEPEILRVQGCSIFEPVKQRAYSPESQAANRRVEVEALATLVDELQDNSATGTPSVGPTTNPIAHLPNDQ